MTLRLRTLLLSMSALGIGLAAGCRVLADSRAPAVPVHHGHRVVFEVNVGEELWEGILNNVENLKKSFGAETVSIEVVAHAKGLALLLPREEALQKRLGGLHDAGVTFAACENTMKKQNVTKAELVPFATTVDSGVAEVVRRQEAGWAYIKGGG